MVYDPMNDLLKTIDKQMEEKGIIAKEVTPKGSVLPIDVPKPKNSRVENLENVFEKPKKLHDLDKYLIFAFSSLIIYTIISLVIFTITGTEPAVLTGCFFAAFGGEILMCALIKRLKLHKEVKNDS